MRQLQRVLWTKGVLLSPQHLQIQDRYLESVVEFSLGALSPFPWGFTRLQVDPEALAGGVLSLTSAAGIFPDGLPFDVPGVDAPVEPRPLEGCWQPDQRALTVHLGVPEYRLGGQNVAERSNGVPVRYSPELVMRRDENTGQAEKPVQVARKNLRIVVEGDSQEGVSTLPVARVLRGAGGELTLDPQFVAPLLDLSASDHLLSITRRLLELLTAKSSRLAESRRQRNRSLADFGASDVANFWLLYTVNTYLPQVRHYFESRTGHPEALFRVLLSLAGALTTFSPEIGPGALPTYDHADPGACFGRLDAVIRELLETTVPASHVTLPLQPTEPLIHATAIEEDRYFSAPQMYLAIRAEARPEEIARRVPQLVKVSSADQVDRLVRQALPGIPLRHAAVPPSALPVKLDYQYFLLERAGAAWDAVRVARNLAAYVPSDFPDPQLELVILLPARQR